MRRLQGKRWVTAIHSIIERDGHVCKLCGRELTANWSSLSWLRNNEVSLDHIIPMSRGGSNRRDNLIVVHIPCNRRKADEMKGLLLTREMVRKAWLESHSTTPLYVFLNELEEKENHGYIRIRK